MGVQLARGDSKFLRQDMYHKLTASQRPDLNPSPTLGSYKKSLSSSKVSLLQIQAQHASVAGMFMMMFFLLEESESKMQ